MARGSKYRVSRKRRREGKTNYYVRYRLVKSKHIILVVRKTNRYILAQFIYPTPIGDYTLAAAHSRELVKLFGWKGGTKNTPTAYLVGLLAGLRAKKLGITKAVAYIGLHRPVRGSKIFAVIKGVLDAGIEVPVDKEMLPDDNRIKGLIIAEYAKMLSERDPERFKKQFSAMLNSQFDPRNLTEHFEEIRNRILKTYLNIPERVEGISIIKQILTR
ncbi:MAG: 50S ribosomal protein L18 [Ignisphaera sp.]|jgi:large subunit ribosomal protein L18|nr:50S ribosomal protein L18 [Ignisphaera sp.]MCC6055791.1 50S ribosomal protein L18 [Desulfurococcaceae archaeon]